MRQIFSDEYDPLDVACAAGYSKIVAWLLEYADMDLTALTLCKDKATPI